MLLSNQPVAIVQLPLRDCVGSVSVKVTLEQAEHICLAAPGETIALATAGAISLNREATVFAHTCRQADRFVSLNLDAVIVRDAMEAKLRALDGWTQS